MAEENGSTSETEIIDSTSEQVVVEDIQSLILQEQKQKQEQQPPHINTPAAYNIRQQPNLPCRDLLTGSREDYLKIGVPLYEASIKCDWKAAKAIFDKKPELVRYSITENGETALHIAASAKGPKHVEEFVKNLVSLMEKDDLALENENFNTALYLAAAAGNVEAAKVMVEKNRALLIIPGSQGTVMPLYTAALFGHYKVVKYLYENSKELGDDGWTHENRGWLLLRCAENDMFNIALQIVKKHPRLGTGGVLQVLARKPEAFAETKCNIIRKTIKFAHKHLYSLISIPHQLSQNKHPETGNGVVSARDLAQNPETESNVIGRTIKSVFTFIRSKMGAPEKKSKALPLLNYIWEDIAKKPKKVIDDILRGPPDWKQYEKSSLGNEDQAVKLQRLMSERIVNMHVEIQNVIKQDANPATEKDQQALQLQKLISEHIAKMHVETQNVIRGPAETISKYPSPAKAMRTYSNRILFVAAEMGNTKFVVELIRQYPDLIWKVNDDKLSIFHIAVKHRHEGIYNLLYEIGSMKDLITPLRDPNDNNMLHLVGKSAKQKRLEDVSGVALRMQRELLWFEEVKNMIPPSYRERKNKDGLTPRELFTKEHHELVTQGEKWMKEIAGQCMVVAALIATMVFGAAFTVPGGYDQNNGIPIFHSKLSFKIFVLADAISLFLSTASILYMFLSVFTSRYAERDFLVSVPRKLIVGLTYLFLSITSMMIAFCAGFFILYQNGLLWMPILIALFALIPFFLYIRVQYFVFFEVIRSTFSTRYLFKPKKHVLYYQNPKV